MGPLKATVTNQLIVAGCLLGLGANRLARLYRGRR